MDISSLAQRLGVSHGPLLSRAQELQRIARSRARFGPSQRAAVPAACLELAIGEFAHLGSDQVPPPGAVGRRSGVAGPVYSRVVKEVSRVLSIGTQAAPVSSASSSSNARGKGRAPRGKKATGGHGSTAFSPLAHRTLAEIAVRSGCESLLATARHMISLALGVDSDDSSDSEPDRNNGGSGRRDPVDAALSDNGLGPASGAAAILLASLVAKDGVRVNRSRLSSAAGVTTHQVDVAKAQWTGGWPSIFGDGERPAANDPLGAANGREGAAADGGGKRKSMFPEAGKFVPGATVAAPENAHSRRDRAEEATAEAMRATASASSRAAKKSRRAEPYAEWKARMMGPLEGDIEGPNVLPLFGAPGFARRTLEERRDAAAAAAKAK